MVHVVYYHNKEKALKRHKEALQLSAKQQKRWKNTHLGITELKEQQKIEPLARQKHMDNWHIIEKIMNVIASTNILNNYEKSRLGQ